MAASKLFLVLALSFQLLHVALCKGSATTGLTSAQQCRLDRIQACQPTRRIESEGGVTELWDEEEDQFQCAGVAPIRTVLRPNTISVPQFISAPHLIFIEQGEGILGITFPGCPETFHSGRSAGRSIRGRQQRWEEGEYGRGETPDLHQKVHRIRRGDIIAIPEGTVHWCHNDGNEELVAVSVADLNNQANQLDQRLRAFFLAGGQGRQSQQPGQRGERFNIQNIFQPFDDELLAEAYNIPTEIARNLKRDDNRGIILNVQERMRVMVPDEQQEEEYYEEEGRRRFHPRRGYGSDNGFEETFCTMRVKHNTETRREADVYSRQAGRVNIVNMHKLPILQWIDMSAERGNLLPNALYTLHWSMTDHRIVYVTGGDAHVQIVDQNGRNVFDEQVSQGSMFVIPQFFASVTRAGSSGFEWITFKTSSQPMKSPLAGYTSVFRALPIQVITNAYQVSNREAQQLKYNREHQTFLLSPSRRSIRMSA
ncbi:11S globulin seed storage protein 2-like [Punica granatum]|uniref:Cupin type-1 domain-containing protein n=2 Tax=Punica granatum TaxID=22663 RepID=A0A218X986_PUNGR|nr:11S globulin seed storage protein 2-like [Punica granatum]OWM81493.1 hypothetical protein CDL15_Pgr007531 [Punica granatum]PKI31082.1 hypothetical protein CRG98_048528 [Punica granatum]